MLDQFDIPTLKVQMFMAAELEMRSLHADPTDTDDETGISRLASLWDHLTHALASLSEYGARRKSKPYQTPKSAPECQDETQWSKL